MIFLDATVGNQHLGSDSAQLSVRAFVRSSLFRLYSSMINCKGHGESTGDIAGVANSNATWVCQRQWQLKKSMAAADIRAICLFRAVCVSAAHVGAELRQVHLWMPPNR